MAKLRMTNIAVRRDRLPEFLPILDDSMPTAAEFSQRYVDPAVDGLIERLKAGTTTRADRDLLLGLGYVFIDRPPA